MTTQNVLLTVSVVQLIIGVVTGNENIITQSVVCAVGFLVAYEINKPRT